MNITSNSKSTDIIIGPGTHGKDAVAEIITKLTGCRFTSASLVICEKAVWPYMKEFYVDQKECFDDRGNHRVYWKMFVDKYNEDAPDRLFKEVSKYSDLYVGLRSASQHKYCLDKGLIGTQYWVEAPIRKAGVVDPSLTITYDPNTMIYINNDGTLEDLEEQVIKNIVDF